MKPKTILAFAAILAILFSISIALGRTASTYPYQYTYVSEFVSFDEKGKAVLVAELNPEILSSNSVDEITLRIPYDDVNIWFVKEQIEKKELVISFWKDYYPYPLGANSGAPLIYPPPDKKIRSSIEYRSSFSEPVLDVETKVIGGSTYVTIQLRGALYSKEAIEKIEKINKHDAEAQLKNLTEKFNQSGKDNEVIIHSKYEVAKRIKLKYSVKNAIEVAEKKGEFEFKSLADVNAPIEVLTIGVSAPYGYKFESKPDFPLATTAELRSAGLESQLASPNIQAFSVSKAAAATGFAAPAAESLSALQKIAADIAEPAPVQPKSKFDYVEIRGDLDADEIVSAKGKYKVIKKPGEFQLEYEWYFPYAVAIAIFLCALAVAQKFKLLWN